MPCGAEVAPRLGCWIDVEGDEEPEDGEGAGFDCGVGGRGDVEGDEELEDGDGVGALTCGEAVAGGEV